MEKLVLKIPGETDYLSRIREFVKDYAAECGFSEEEKGDIEISADEAATNIVKHAYGDDPDINGNDRIIEVEIGAIDNGMEIRFRDRGKPFDPSAYPTPDIARHIAEKKTHGLGIFAMKIFMDEIDYRYIDGVGNQITMRKYRKK